MTAIRYHRDRPWDVESTATPGWDDVATTIRRMDDHFYPIVQLNCSERDDDVALCAIWAVVAVRTSRLVGEIIPALAWSAR